MKKKRPATEWLKWYKKLVLFIFYSVAEKIIRAIEVVEHLLGGDVSMLKKEHWQKEGETIRVIAGKEIDYQKVLPPLVELMRKEMRLCDVQFSEIMKGVDRRPRTISVAGNLPGSPRELTFRTIGYLSAKSRAIEMIRLLAGRGVEMKVLSGVAMRLEGDDTSSSAVLQSLGARVRELRLTKMTGIRDKLETIDMPNLISGLSFAGDVNPSIVYIDVSADYDKFISVAGRAFAMEGVPTCYGLADLQTGTVLVLVADEKQECQSESAALVLFGI